jgi:hypothetical protein
MGDRHDTRSNIGAEIETQEQASNSHAATADSYQASKATENLPVAVMAVNSNLIQELQVRQP